MAPFALLPNELILKIFELVQPEDLENFVQSSRNVFGLVVPFLHEHRALIRQYHTLSNPMGPGAIANLLSTIIANPRIGSYVRKVELGPLMLSQARLDQTNVYTEEELDTFTTAALESECLKRSSEEEALNEKTFWSNAIQSGNEEILLAILLPLLPNLTTFTVEADFTVEASTYPRGRRRRIWYDSAIEKAASATKPTLCKLANINLNPYQGCGYDLAQIQRISALPSVKALMAPKARFLYDLSPDTNSNVTQLNLWPNRIASIPLYEFLRGFSRLQSFVYSYESDEYDETYGTVSREAFWIRSCLLAHCKTTLQNLTLLIPKRTRVAFMGSLRGFETLKAVDLEWSCLLSRCPDVKVSHFNENLPESLVRLKIHDSKGREKSQYEKVIKSAQYAKEHRLQNLKWLIFAGTRVEWSLETIDRDLRKTCLNMGLSLVF